jgi:release factor glutamine methyltransferase
VTVQEVLRRAAEHLGRTSETPRLDAELLLGHALGLSRIELYTEHDRPLTTAELDAYRGLVARRSTASVSRRKPHSPRM